ncbi:MAG TPA: hypothetical protein VLI04_16430 [Nocardioidaceae bacterium]|nr:hypothetical protein [Nocardioidaceae bacterium]
MSEVIETTTTQVVPTWMVSARNGHRVRGGGAEGGRWVPYGLQHARQVGSSTTACGIGAVEWQIFWELQFPGARGATCPDCRRVVELAAEGLIKIAAR